MDPLGAVFVPGGRARKPVYGYGDPKATTRDPMFQCPVSAIPNYVWDLLVLWWRCRRLKTLPAAGGLLDQPATVQHVFPIFEDEYAGIERAQHGGGAERAAALAVGAMVKAMKGGR